MGQVYASDWNPLQTTIANVMGAPNGLSYGWNKASSIKSAQVNSTLQINHTHYNLLKDDIDYCYNHIVGYASSLPTKNTGDRVYQVDLANISAAITFIYNNRTVAAASQLTTANMLSIPADLYSFRQVLGATWKFSWASVGEFNSFWNGGGSVYWNLAFAGTAGNLTQAQSWTNLLANSGFEYITPTTSGQVGNAWAGSVNITGGISGFSTVPSTFITVYDQDANYTMNYYQSRVWLDALPGSATALYVNLSLYDDHSASGAGPDSATGNLTVSINQKYPYTYASNSTINTASTVI
jgi:hypothetical protein